MTYYFVKWKGWPSETNTWEPRRNLVNCANILKQFHEQLLGIKLNGNLMKQKRLLSQHQQQKQNGIHHRKNWGKNVQIKNDLTLKYLSRVKKYSLKKCPKTESTAKALNGLLADYKYRQKRQRVLAELKQWEKQINAVAPEEAPIIVENGVDLEGPPQNFTYINDYKAGEGIIIPDDPLVGCDCTDCYENRNSCCAHQSGGTFAYSRWRRVVVPKGTPIYECNRRCCCGPECINRMVQHGRKVKLAIFRTSNGCGWGVKALQKIRKGEFVMEYVGEVITNEEAEKRGKVYDAEGRTYLFDLDYNDGDCPFTVDAAHYGNASHFMNHSCDPNLSVYGVWINTLDPRLPRIAFFTNRDVHKGEELTFDYKMTGDTTGTRNLATPENDAKRIPCKCGSQQCRKFLF